MTPIVNFPGSAGRCGPPLRRAVSFLGSSSPKTQHKSLCAIAYSAPRPWCRQALCTTRRASDRRLSVPYARDLDIKAVVVTEGHTAGKADTTTLIGPLDAGRRNLTSMAPRPLLGKFRRVPDRQEP